MQKIKAKVIPIHDKFNGVTWLMTSKFGSSIFKSYEVHIIGPNFESEFSNLNGHIMGPDNDYIFNCDPSDVVIMGESTDYLYVWLITHFSFCIKSINIEEKKQHALLYDYKQIGEWFYSIPKSIAIYFKNHIEDKKKYIELWLLFVELHDTRKIILSNILELEILDLDRYKIIYL